MYDLSQKTYVMADVCHFSKAKEPFGGFGNMTGGFSIKLNDLTICSSESLYQAMRFPFFPGIQAEILAQKGGMGAKMVAKKYRATHTRNDWDKIQVEVMEWCILLKLANHPETFGQLLIDSLDKTIVEFSKNDSFWGAVPDDQGNLIGANVLGQIIEQIRSDYFSLLIPILMKDQDPLISLADVDKPFLVKTPRVQNFQLLGRYIPDQDFSTTTR